MIPAISTILDKCSIFYDGSLISKESILEKYITFFANSIDPQSRNVAFALHTGSICFDVISVVAAGIGCLSFNLTTNDDIIAALQPGDMIVYKGQRYRWVGMQNKDGTLRIVIEQDGKGRNGKSTSYLPAEKNKHLIKPYYGDSQVTDGRGIRKKKSNREDFLAFAFDMDVADIPTQINVSIVIVANRTEFDEICKHVKIMYGEGKEVGLLDIIPAAYYTSSGEVYQFGPNPTKSEPVLKVTGKISTARDLVLDKRGNSVVGLLVTGGTSLLDAGSELEDLLHRKTLHFVHIMSPLKPGMGERIIEMNEDALLFACTKEFLTNNKNEIYSQNRLTSELHRQISNIVNNTVASIQVPNGWHWDEYKKLKNAILAIKQSNWEDAKKDDFIVTAYGLTNLLNTAIFPMAAMEQAIEEGVIIQTVTSPKTRIAELWDIANCAGSMQENCIFVADTLERKYMEFMERSPKGDILGTYVSAHTKGNVVIVVPKAYYADILKFTHPEYFDSGDTICVTANRFDMGQECDAILCVGEISGRKFDPLQCLSSKNIDVLLYECEETVFTHRKRKQAKNERKINRKIGALQSDVNLEPEEEESPVENEIEADVRNFSTLDEYIDRFNVFDIRKLAQNSTSVLGTSPVSEVKYVGTFVSGEQIFFSRYYSAVVFDGNSGTVSEKASDELASGDVLVFAERNDYTKNIVDFIYEKLLQTGRLEEGAVDAYEKSQYWKEALREYKETRSLTYREVAKKLREAGGSMQEVTVRQWIIEDSHIVGPRRESTLECIAAVTQDPYLLADTHGYFEACDIVRHDRRKILDLITRAINDRLSGNIPPEGEVLSVVYDNVDKLSKTLELENISELDESVNISSNLVNTPITEAEVSM